MTQDYTTSDGTTTTGPIMQGFEGHIDGENYTNARQKEDWDHAFGGSTARYAEITDDEAKSGDQSLQVNYSSRHNDAAASSWRLPEEDVYYLSYWVKFEDDFDFDGDDHSGGKLPGLASDGLASGGGVPDGDDGFTARYMWRDDGAAELYLYHMDQPGKFGESFVFLDDEDEPISFSTGTWHNLVQRVEINTGNQANGAIDVWMDGTQVLDLDGLQFVDDGSQIDRFYFSSFFGGSGKGWLPDEDVAAYFDDIVISTDPNDVGLRSASASKAAVTEAEPEAEVQAATPVPQQPAPLADDATMDALDMYFDVKKDWGNSALVELHITNTSDDDVDNWQAAFALDDLEIEKIWRGDIIAVDDERYVIEGMHSRSEIAAGDTVTIGMIVDNGALEVDALNQAAGFSYDF